ncbi:c-type cytochrome [Oceanibacterium hippocampi]|uniref:Cytochrome c n=1 Tax=Oceanibacterium hippocampi TaxID=745714 RepID=A0A1Y5S168_9PROT|nr:cytochrome c [Oceanibacterium hippocampi]SLN29720.1 Cytochrome c' [Oceanibacterium hippocampi]
MKFRLLITVAALALTAGSALAEDDTPRQHVMKVIAGNMGAIGKVAKGEAEYSPALIENALEIHSLSKVVTALFPQGSKFGRAKDEIWSDWAGFEMKAKAFNEATPALVAAVKSGDQAQIGAALGAVGKTCGGCHETYRTPKD